MNNHEDEDLDMVSGNESGSDNSGSENNDIGIEDEDDEDDSEDDAATIRRRKRASTHMEPEQVIAGVPNELLLPGAIVTLAVVIVGVFALGRLTSR